MAATAAWAAWAAWTSDRPAGRARAPGVGRSGRVAAAHPSEARGRGSACRDRIATSSTASPARPPRPARRGLRSVRRPLPARRGCNRPVPHLARGAPAGINGAMRLPVPGPRDVLSALERGGEQVEALLGPCRGCSPCSTRPRRWSRGRPRIVDRVEAGRGRGDRPRSRESARSVDAATAEVADGRVASTPGGRAARQPREVELARGRCRRTAPASRWVARRSSSTSSSRR